MANLLDDLSYVITGEQPDEEESQDRSGAINWLARMIWGDEEPECPSCMSEYGDPEGFCPVCGKWDIRTEDEIDDQEFAL